MWTNQYLEDINSLPIIPPGASLNSSLADVNIAAAPAVIMVPSAKTKKGVSSESKWTPTRKGWLNATINSQLVILIIEKFTSFYYYQKHLIDK